MEIKDEWNEIANERLKDRLNGNDLSYNELLLPIIISNVKKCLLSGSKILDFGCGTGELTYEVAQLNQEIIGLDISASAIRIAKSHFNHPKLNFLNAFLSDVNFDNEFDIIIASMSFMDTEELPENLKKIFDAAKDGAKLLVTITHPCFWPIYWNYFDNKDFEYEKESRITQTYRTANKVFEGFETSHFHRPISYYLNLFSKVGFNLLSIKELKRTNDSVWYPRFLYFELEKTAHNSA